jgi:hypothetical protein
VLWRIPRFSVPVWLPVVAITLLWMFELVKLGVGIPL